MFLFPNTEDVVRADAASKGSLSFAQNRDSVLNGDVIVVFTSNQGTVTLNSAAGITRKTNTAALVEFDIDLLPTHKATLLGDRKKITVQWKASFAVPGGYYVEGDGYEGEFQIEGAAVSIDPFLPPLYKDANGNYLPFDQIPYLEGSTTALKALFAGATSSFVDAAVLDDSQGSLPNGSGIQYLTELNRLSYERYGAPRKTPFYRFGVFVSTNAWCTGLQSAGSSSVGSDGPNLLVYRGINAAGTAGPLNTLYPDAGGLADGAGTIYFPDNTNTLRWQVVLKRVSAESVVEARIVHQASVADREYFVSETTTNYNSTGLNLNSADDEYVLFESGNLIYYPAQPWHNPYVHGLNSGGTPEAGLHSIGSRYIDTSRNQGACFTSFSEGSFTVDNHLSSYPNFGAIISAFSGDPFDVVFVGLGTNDAGAGLSPEDWKVKVASLITKIRTDFGANIPVVLVGEPPRNDFSGSAANKNNFDRYPAVLGELAQQTAGVSFLNLTRKLYDVSLKFGNASGNWLSDTVHLQSYSQRLAAEKIFELIDEIP